MSGMEMFLKLFEIFVSEAIHEGLQIKVALPIHNDMTYDKAFCLKNKYFKKCFFNRF